MFSLLFQDPVIFIAWLLAIIYAITIHEFAHALAAYWQGDSTAKEMGRLTLNPLAHVELTGLIVLIFAGFGWGRPTPVNPNNLKHGKKSDNLVSLAGVAVNLLSVFVFGIILKLLVTYAGLEPENLLAVFLSLLIIINLSLSIFNLLPIPPLDGSHILFNILSDRFNNFKIAFSQNGPWILLIFILADNFLNLGIFQHLFQFFFRLVGLIL